MLAIDLISDSIPPLKPTDNGIMILNWMDEFRVTHLPIVNNKEYIGLISEMEILDNEISDDEIGKSKITLMRPSVMANQHIYEAIKIVSNLKLSVLPVVDEEQNYLGLIPTTDLIYHFSELAAANEPGGIIILDLNMNDYHLSQIAKIAEDNDTKILSFYLKHIPNSTKMEATLKLNREYLTGVIQTFNRYNYIVKASYFRSEYNDDLKSRYDSFMKYLNM